jgi:hypothetical protein
VEIDSGTNNLKPYRHHINVIRVRPARIQANDDRKPKSQRNTGGTNIQFLQTPDKWVMSTLFVLSIAIRMIREKREQTICD